MNKNARVAGLLFFAAAVAQAAPSISAPAAPPQASGESADFSMEIKLETSRPQPSAGSGLGIAAEFKNKSKSTVLYLDEETTTLTLPPELEGPFSVPPKRSAIFPTEGRNGEIAIPPGNSYRAAWTMGVEDTGQEGSRSPAPPGLWASSWHQVRSEIRYIFFTPGDYKVFVDARVGAGKSPKLPGYYTITETAVVKAAAPQFVILLGAVIGGFISWFLFPQGTEKSVVGHDAWSTMRKTFAFTYGLAGAGLFAAIVTILLARLSETQFLVKVSVSDFWGAIATGFIVQYLGKTVLDKIFPERRQANIAPKPNQPGPVTPPVAPNVTLPPPQGI